MFEKLEKANINQTEKEIDEKMAEAMTIIQKSILKIFHTKKVFT